MHAESRPCVHLADGAPGLAIGLGDVGREKIHTAHIQIDGLDGTYRHVPIVRMNDVRDVDGGAAGGKVCGIAQVNDLTCRGHGLARVAQIRQQPLRLVIKLEACQHFLVTDAAAWVRVDFFYQRLDAALAIANNMPRHTLGRRHQLTVHHQKAVIEPFDEAFNDDGTMVLACFLEGGFDFFRALQMRGHATTVIGIQWLEDHRIADALGGSHGAAGIVDEKLLGYRQTEIGEDAIRLFLVGCQIHGDLPRIPRNCRLYTALIAPVSELDQALPVQPQPRDLACLGGLDQ